MPEQTENNSDSKSEVKRSFTKRLVPSNKRSKLVVAVVALLVIGGLSFLGYRLISNSNKNSKNAGKVGDHVVTKAELQYTFQEMQRAGFYPSEDRIKSLVMDYWLYQLIANEYGISVTDKQAVDYLKTETVKIKPAPKLDMNNQYVRYRAYSDILQSKIAVVAISPSSGAYVLAHFDQNLGAQSTPAQKKLSKDEFKALQEADKKYAADFINNIAARLKAGTITFSQAMKLEKDDSKIGQKALPTSAHSSTFGKAIQASTITQIQDISTSPAIAEKIKSLKPGETSKPFIMKVQTSITLNSPTVDGIWVIVKVDKDNSNGAPKFSTVNTALQYFKQKYGYETYN